MANDFFTKSGSPVTGSSLQSAPIRTEIANIEAGFDKMPTLTGNGGEIIAVNSGATALEAITTTGTGSGVRATSPTLVTPVLGTPSSGTLTNCTGLPLAGVVDSTTEALGVGSLEVGHATDTTITRVGAGGTIAVEGVNVLTTATGAALAGSASQAFATAALTATNLSVTSASTPFTPFVKQSSDGATNIAILQVRNSADKALSMGITAPSFSGAYLTGGTSGASTFTNTSTGYNYDVGIDGTKVATFSPTGLAVTGAISATTTGKVGTTLGVGNATPSASGAGITFPATQSASSDANTLDDYEEGTWTPDQGSGLTLVGAFSSSGKYTKIGRLVTVSGMVAGATTVALAGGGQLCSNLPFSQAATEDPYGVAVLTSSGNPAGSAFVLSLQITGSVAQPAVANIKFTVTYFV